MPFLQAVLYRYAPLRHRHAPLHSVIHRHTPSRVVAHIHLGMAFLQGGTLAQLLSQAVAAQPQPGVALPEAHVRFYAAQLVLALGALHARGMLYLDLKLENVMLTAQVGHPCNGYVTVA